MDQRGPSRAQCGEEELRRRRPAVALTEDDIRAMVESLGDPSAS
jgi:hypothetical protein